MTKTKTTYPNQVNREQHWDRCPKLTITVRGPYDRRKITVIRDGDGLPTRDEYVAGVEPAWGFDGERLAEGRAFAGFHAALGTTYELRRGDEVLYHGHTLTDPQTRCERCA